jgi:ABC-2 type transport system permease protein
MTVAAALTAERIKLQTTRSPLWSAIAAAGLSVGFAMILASTAPMGTMLLPERAVIGLASFGVPIMMILAAMTVTGEYRSGMIRTTFGAMPNRTLVLAAKAAVSALFAAAFCAVMAVASIAVARAVAGPEHGRFLSFAEAATWRPVWAMAVYAALGAMLAVGLAALLRHAAGVIALLFLLPFVVEPLVGALPDVGTHVGPLLPFVNAYTFIQVPFTTPYEMYWGPMGALLYFTAVVVIVFLLGVLVINRRDA